MQPLFSPPTDERDTSSRQSMSSALTIALGVTVLAFLLALFMAAGRATSFVLPMLIGFLVAIIGGLVLVRQITARSTPDKGKRYLAETDMYSLINRLVDDLNDDELAYLERRIEARKHALDRDVVEGIDELLDQRDEARRSGQR